MLAGLVEEGLAVEAEVGVFAPSRPEPADVTVVEVEAAPADAVVEAALGMEKGVVAAAAAAAVADFSAAIAVRNSFSMVSCSFK